MNGGSHSPRASTSRRSSYSQVPNGSLGRASGSRSSPLAVQEVSPKKIVTAECIAHEYFTRIMATNTHKRDLYTMADGAGDKKNTDGAPDERKKEKEHMEGTETVVILHDACYGHRFSRPKTSKSALSSIVERPERIHATILGVSAAYVRLGEFHPDGKNAIVPESQDGDTEEDKESMAKKPFGIIKSSRRLALGEQAVTNVHGVKWMEELTMLCKEAEVKLAHNGKELIRPTMDRGKGAEEPQKFHEGDLYLCSESLEAMEGALGAVCDGVDAIFADGGGAAGGQKTKRAFVVVRPPGHHCSASYPSGFCWVNNVHVGIQHAALAHNLTHAAIIDFDLHHGDGSQDITWSHNERATSLPKNAPAWKKTAIGYFSIHDINSYPCEMGDTEKVKNASLCIENAHGQNIWNVHLAPWKTEEEFWKLYENKYTILLEKCRHFLKGQTERINEAGKGVKPRAAIFLSAGFDASEHESSGMQRHKVNVPTEFYARLTLDVRRIAEESGTSVEGRIISVLEGGYSYRALCSGAFSHVSGLAGADPDSYNKPIATTGLGVEVARRMGSLSLTSAYSNSGLPAYDPAWWSLPNLEALEAASPPPPAPIEPKKPRETRPPATYYASTQSFDAKIIDSPKGRRSSSGLFAHPPPHGYKPSTQIPIQTPRAPTPPPPEVSWATAAKELCKVLIPIDRQTMSCRPEDLNAAATRERKERQSLTIQSAKDILITPPQSGPVSPKPTPSIRKSTRERKPARPVDNAAEEAARAAAASRTSRRRTVAGVGVIAQESARPAVGSRGASHRESARPVAVAASSTASRSPTRRASLASNVDSTMGGMEPPPAPVARTHGNDGAAEQGRTSTTVRPGSSASTRGAPAGVTVRKTRAPPAPRSASAGLGGARAPVARQPSGFVPAAGGVRKPSGATGPPQTDGSSERREQRGVSMEMDTLTSSMSKANIASAPVPKPRIFLTTKAQREAKAAETAKQAFDKTETAAGIEDAHELTGNNQAAGQEESKQMQTTEMKIGMGGPQPIHLTQPAPSSPPKGEQQPRPDYSSTTSQLHASQQLQRFGTEEEMRQQDSTANFDQLQHNDQRREEQRYDQQSRVEQDAADQQSVLEQLQEAAKAAAEIAESGKCGAMSPPPRPTTANSGSSRPQSATSGASPAGVRSPSSIQDRIARLAHMSNVALESAREMGGAGSGRSSFSDVKSPPRAPSVNARPMSGAGGEFGKAMGGMAGQGPVGVKREELPVWSATGAIPFAQQVRKEEEKQAEVKTEEVAGDVEMGGY